MCFDRISSFSNKKQIKRFLKPIQKKDRSQRNLVVSFLSAMKFFRNEGKTTDFKNRQKVSSSWFPIFENPRKKRFSGDVEDSRRRKNDENMTFLKKKGIMFDEMKNPPKGGGVEQLGSSSGS